GDAAKLLVPGDDARLERRAQFVLVDDDFVDLALRRRVVLQDGGDGDVGLGDREFALRDLFGGLRVFRRLLRDGAARDQRLAAGARAFLLLVIDLGAVPERLGAG